MKKLTFLHFVIFLNRGRLWKYYIRVGRRADTLLPFEVLPHELPIYFQGEELHERQMSLLSSGGFEDWGGVIGD